MVHRSQNADSKPKKKRGRKVTLPPSTLESLGRLITAQVNFGIECTPSGLRPLVLALLQQEVPELLKVNGGRFECSETWLRRFIRISLGLVMRRATTARSVPND